MNKKQKAKRIKLIIILAVLLVLGAVLVWQLFFSYSVKMVFFLELKEDEVGLEDKMQGYRESPNVFFNGDLRSDNPFPTENYEDYSTLFLNIVFQNSGFLKFSPTEMYIERVEPGPEIVIRDNHLFVAEEWAESYSSLTCGVCTLDVCRRGLSDEEVLEILKDYKVTVYAKNAISSSLKFEICLADYDLTLKPVPMPGFVESAEQQAQ